MRIRDVSFARGPEPESEWLPYYPNPADMRFNYYRLLETAWSTGAGIGVAPSSDIHVAVVGAGVAGIAAARELVRAGYHVTIYEATERICGRHYTWPGPGVQTGMELGAMRFPYFEGEGNSPAGSANCLFDYYLTFETGQFGHQAIIAPFPNPGGAPGNTGIYMNGGYGPNDEFDTPTMIQWPYGNDAPNDPYLDQVHRLVATFTTNFAQIVRPAYATSEWPEMWRQISEKYDQMSFSDLVYAAPLSPAGYNNDGWLGGFGMNDVQSELFYTIGSGDGSWGAFYEVSAMWFIRCVMFGFNSTLQAVMGLNNATTAPFRGTTFLDSGGVPIPAPTYAGIQSLAEWLFFGTTSGMNASLAAQMNASGLEQDPMVLLFQKTPVTKISKNATGSLTITDGNGGVRDFQYAVVTAPIWASEMTIKFEGFTPQELPFTADVARREQHIIASVKVFFPLKECYWKNGSPIPQIIVTDTFLQDAYGVQWDENDPGVLLASYTWEDDAAKLSPYLSNAQNPAAPEGRQLADMVLSELDRITRTTVNDSIAQYVDNSNPIVWSWAAADGYNGCAKLYRQRNWAQNLALLAYNQNYSALSGLYFAGESYSVEGGWTEPALRLAIDAVVRIIYNSGGTFVEGFDFDSDYGQFPTYGVSERYPYPPM